MSEKDLIGNGERSGWTNIHSWVFLGIVAVGLLVLGVQNRYHYLSPLGLGKAYRIDKLFGGIQEFDPSKGWIVAQLQMAPPQQAMSMLEPSAPLMPPGSMNMPGSMPPTADVVQPKAAAAPTMEKEAVSVVPVQPKEQIATTPARPAVVPEMNKEEKYKLFQKMFADFGDEEFQLANDDLYPDWRKRFAPNGNWPEFLGVYRDFILWWNDAGNPSDSGFKLWQDFLSTRVRN
jgi:hypothetical protein